MSKQKSSAPASATARTSTLPFAALHGDLPYLDFVESGSRLAIDKLAKHIGDGAPAVQFAELNNAHNRQLQGWVTVLKSIETQLSWAYRGGSPEGASAVACFGNARAMLDLAIGQIELMADGAGCDLDDFCEREQVNQQGTVGGAAAA